MKTIILRGSIVGVTTAYYMAKIGRKVTVVDRQPGVAQETSYANTGLVAQAAKMARTIWTLVAKQQDYQWDFQSVRPLRGVANGQPIH